MSLVAGDSTRSQAEQSTAKLCRLAMSINRINDALLKAMDTSPPTDGTVFVCHATEDEWNEFVASEDEDPLLSTKYLEWFEAASEIHIIEFPSAAHETLIVDLAVIFRADVNVKRWLVCRGGSANREGPSVQPDIHFGPNPRTPGAVRPRLNMEWDDFNTIKVEIGVLQQWGERVGQLDYKAVAVWYGMPGAEYVLCVKTDDQYTTAQYKLYDFQVRGGPRPAVQPQATLIAPGVTVSFDAHRILGIPTASPLPPGFPDPFVVDLHAVLAQARHDRV